MKNTFGSSIALTLFGESHGAAVGAVLDGVAPGIPVDAAAVERQLARRRPRGGAETARREADRFEILSGVFNGRTTGTPLCIVIRNEEAHSEDYRYGLARPSHADFAAYCKYHGHEDYRGGGHFSGRVTAALVAAGAILQGALEGLGIRIGTHVLRCGGVADRAFGDDVAADLAALAGAEFPVLDAAQGERMVARILEAKAALDSVGGVTQTAIAGLPAGLGEPWFDSVEGMLSHALFSLGGVKGVEFGLGFGLAERTAGTCNDELCVEGGQVRTRTNFNGGVNGGITNGMPVTFQCAVKPTPSIAREQRTVDFTKGTEAPIEIKGRHDPAIVRRIVPVIDAVSALVVADLLALRYGTDVLAKGREALGE